MFNNNYNYDCTAKEAMRRCLEADNINAIFHPLLDEDSFKFYEAKDNIVQTEQHGDVLIIEGRLDAQRTRKIAKATRWNPAEYESVSVDVVVIARYINTNEREELAIDAYDEEK